MGKKDTKIKTIIKFGLLAALTVLFAAAVPLTGCAEHPHKKPPLTEMPIAIHAPDFTVKNADGKDVALSSFFGKPIVLNFWATWCPPCQKELPDFDKMYKLYGDKVQFLMVNLDGEATAPKTVKQYMEDVGFSFPLYFDLKGDAASVYRVSSIPVSYFIDAERNIVSSHLGAIQEKQLEKEIKKLLP